MTCKQVQKTISLYLDDRMSLTGRALFQEHLEKCAACSRELLALQRSLDSLTVLQREAPREGGWERLKDRLPTPAPRVHTSWLPVWGWRGALAGAAIALAAVIAVSLHSTPKHGNTVAHSPAPGTKLTRLAAHDQVAATAAEGTRAAGTPLVKIAGSAIRQTSAVKSGAITPRSHAPKHQAARQQGPSVEPDPESAVEVTASAVTPAPEEMTQMVSGGLEPLVAAAQTSSDPLYWLSDVDTEDWL